jgi:hypothetical protein
MRQRRHCKRFFDHKYIINLFLLKTASLQILVAGGYLYFRSVIDGTHLDSTEHFEGSKNVLGGKIMQLFTFKPGLV